MKTRNWNVGLLKEIHPIHDSSILGYNQNKGQVIALRLRTKNMDGFRNYNSIKKVLLHELAHMIHSDHDNLFKELNSELNKDALKFDWTTSQGYKIDQGLDVFDDGDLELVDGGGIQGRVLGGNGETGDVRKDVRDAVFKRFQ